MCVCSSAIRAGTRPAAACGANASASRSSHPMRRRSKVISPSNDTMRGSVLVTPAPMAKRSRVNDAVPAEAVDQAFPALHLPVTPPYPPMEARSATAIPSGRDWIYEPKWDGFRCLAFRDGRTVALQSKSGQALHRYFPELVAALLAVKPAHFVVDG